jgi:cytochrome P450
MAEATSVLARLVQAFQIELVDGKPVRPTAVVTTAPDRAVSFRLRSRDA